MKIAIDASRANCIKKTGVEKYAFDLISSIINLSDNKDEFILYLKDKPNKDWNFENNKNKNVFFKNLFWPPKFLWSHLRLGFSLIFNKYDITFIPAHVIPIFHKKPIITTIHDISFKRYPQSYSKFQNFYQDIAVKLALNNACKIIVPSNFVKKDLQMFYGANENQIKVIYHGIKNNENKININEFIKGEQKKNLLQKYKIKKDFILFIGRIETKKNLCNLIEAFNIYKENGGICELVLAGSNGYGFDEIKNYALKSKFKDEIIFTGWVEQDEINYLLHCSSIFAYIGFSEGFGFPILEAFLANIPVVTSKIGASSEIAGDCALLVDPFCPKEIAESFGKIINDSFFTENIKLKAKERAKIFTLELCAQKTLHLIKTCVDK